MRYLEMFVVVNYTSVQSFIANDESRSLLVAKTQFAIDLGATVPREGAMAI